MSNPDDIPNLIRSRRVRFADLWFTDMPGRPWRISMPADAVDKGLLRSGLPLDGQPIGGAWDGIMILEPQCDAVYPDPVAAAPTLAMICDVLDPESRRASDASPRDILRRAAHLIHKRLGADVVIGAEPEFTLLGSASRPESDNDTYDFLRGLALALRDAGIQVDWFRTGPAAGQGRVQMHPGPALLLADRVLLYRHTAAHLARKRGSTASFLPKPTAGEGAPGMPIHQSLWKDGRNLFHDGAGWATTSELCRWYAGGLLAHLPALLAFCAPTTNSYRRLVPGVSGPTGVFLSASIRAAACRIPARSPAPEARRIKFSPPDSTANPYLAIAAVIMAGLDGIERKIEAPIDGPSLGFPAAPGSLEAALESLANDRGFLTAGGVFKDTQIEAWLQDRWARHVIPVRIRPHPWELSNSDFFNPTSCSAVTTD